MMTGAAFPLKMISTRIERYSGKSQELIDLSRHVRRARYEY